MSNYQDEYAYEDNDYIRRQVEYRSPCSHSLIKETGTLLVICESCERAGWWEPDGKGGRHIKWESK